jgi:hypothetical protein
LYNLALIACLIAKTLGCIIGVALNRAWTALTARTFQTPRKSGKITNSRSKKLGVFSCPELEAAELLCSTVLHRSISFLFGKNCPNID